MCEQENVTIEEIKILILAANPRSTPPRRLEEEVREIKEGLRRSRYRDHFKIHSVLTLRFRDLRRALLDYEPHIVHFIGYGNEDSLILENELGFPVLIPSEKFSELLELCKDHVECVILNACYTESQAAAIRKHINYVFGIRKEIEDKAAIEFAVGFYDALGAGKSVDEAFRFGKNALLENFAKSAACLIPPWKEKVIAKKEKVIKKILLISTSLAILITAFTLIYKDCDSHLSKPKMIRISEGNFLRGASDSEIEELLNSHLDWKSAWFNDESPQREISLDEFYISKFEITNAQYRAFLEDNPNRSEPAHWNDPNFNKEDQPVVGVSWKDAVAFCNWLSKKTNQRYRLPTETEWEKAARGTDGRIYPWGNEAPDINKANFMEQHPGTVSVNEKEEGASFFQVLNMAGNAAEWCSDWYDENSYRSTDTNNPVVHSDLRRKVVRGGSWKDNALFLRCSDRSSYPPSTINDFIGFRIVREPENKNE